MCISISAEKHKAAKERRRRQRERAASKLTSAQTFAWLKCGRVCGLRIKNRTLQPPTWIQELTLNLLKSSFSRNQPLSSLSRLFTYCKNMKRRSTAVPSMHTNKKLLNWRVFKNRPVVSRSRSPLLIQTSIKDTRTANHNAGKHVILSNIITTKRQTSQSVSLGLGHVTSSILNRDDREWRRGGQYRMTR